MQVLRLDVNATNDTKSSTRSKPRHIAQQRNWPIVVFQTIIDIVVVVVVIIIVIVIVIVIVIGFAKKIVAILLCICAERNQRAVQRHQRFVWYNVTERESHGAK